MADKTFERRDDQATKARSVRVDQGRYPWWVWLITIAGSILMIVGAILALTGPSLLVGGNAQINEAADVYAGYFVSRNSAIGVFLLAGLILRARASLSTMMVLTAAIQLADAIMDCLERRWTVVPLALFIGAVFLIAARHVAKRPISQVDASR